ncbi:MAG: hypothetical protein OXH09_11950 [Gammaproteobacteria bacterium]|nr:hypothetical protein [Gammaproteobacteria bacterium]
MKYFVLTYDPRSDREPRVREFNEHIDAFRELESQTIENLGREGIEVVLFINESETALRSTNQRYFNPEVTRRLRENPSVLASGLENMRHGMSALGPRLTSTH